MTGLVTEAEAEAAIAKGATDNCDEIDSELTLGGADVAVLELEVDCEPTDPVTVPVVVPLLVAREVPEKEEEATELPLLVVAPVPVELPVPGEVDEVCKTVVVELPVASPVAVVLT